MCETDDEPRGLADISVDCPHCDRLVGHAYNVVAFHYQCDLGDCPHCRGGYVAAAMLDMARANYYWVSYPADPLACESLWQRLRAAPAGQLGVAARDILDCIAAPHAHLE